MNKIFIVNLLTWYFFLSTKQIYSTPPKQKILTNFLFREAVSMKQFYAKLLLLFSRLKDFLELFIESLQELFNSIGLRRRVEISGTMLNGQTYS